MGSQTQKQLIGFISFLTFLFCAVIAFDIFPFLRGPAPYPPDWQWDYLFVNTLSKLWVPVLCIGAALFFAFFVEGKTETYITKHTKKLLVICVVLFFCIQLSVTYFSRAGIGVLFQRIANPDMNGYFTAANHITNIPLFLKEFNTNVLSLPMHAQGHPPGAILFFWGIEQMVRPVAPLFSFITVFDSSHSDVSFLWKTLSLSQKVTALFTAVFIPFLSALSCIFVYFIGRYLAGVRVGMRAALLLLTIPSLTLFIPINDVFLSLFPLSAFFCFIKGIKEKNRFLLFSSGVLFSLGLFFSLSLLPLLWIFGVYLLWIKNIREILLHGIYFSVGIFLLPILLFLLYGYNTIAVSQTLLQGLPESRAYATWVIFNLSDFFIFLGIPLFVIFFLVILNLFQNLTRFRLGGRNDTLVIDPLSVGFISMILLLDISGTVRGEVARIWVPFYPFLAIILAQFLTTILQVKKSFLLFLILLQFVQILVMQEFWVLLW